MSPPAIDRGRLGAWMLTCNPRLTDPVTVAAVDRWCVASNYRGDLMAAGDPVLLWLAGSDPARWPRGVRGLGALTGPAGPRGAGRAVPLRLSVWPATLDVDTLVAAGLGDLEVLRQPRTANPSFVTAAQWRRLQALLPG